MADIEFTPKPPKDTRGGGAKSSTSWQEIADACRANPGQWAKVPKPRTVSTVTNISQGKIVAFRGGGFQAVSRGNGTKADIYVCYVGDER